MEIIKDKALKLKVKHPKRITEVIPKSKQVSEHEVLVNWGVPETKVLRNLNINAPSPIERQYNWTGKYSPFDHQVVTSSFFTMHSRCFCFNEMGTGKTASVIWASDFLLNQKEINRVLIVCPLSIMDSAWRADLFTFAMHRRVDIAHGTPTKRKAIINGDAEYVIINYEGIEIVLDELLNGGFDLVVVDEANAYKNAKSKRWKVLNRLIDRDTRLWMMTGTPAAQSPLDAYGLAKLVNPSAVPQFFGSWRDQVMNKVTQFKYVPKADATDTVFRVLQPAIRYTKEECLDLPEVTMVKRKVDLTPQQSKYYKDIKNKMVIAADGEEVTAANAAIVMNKLLQISSGAVYSDNGESLMFDIKNRYKVLKEVIDESSQKVLIFAPFKHVISSLSDKLRADGLSCDVISGAVNVSKRTEIFKSFQQNPDPQVLIIQPQAAAHGVTLTAANTVVWWGPTSSLDIFYQANARIHRAGQKHKCTVVQLIGSAVEDHVYSLLDQRIDVHSKVVDLYKQLLD
jgi:SNF2 family DNA or RNA helicase